MRISTDGYDFGLSQMLPETSASLLAALAQQNLLLDMDAFHRLSTAGYGPCTTKAMLTLQTVVRICPTGSHSSLNIFKLFTVCRSAEKQNTTYTRICRALLHILLNIRQDDYAALWQPDGIPYLRVLGFRRNSSALLSSIKKKHPFL